MKRTIILIYFAIFCSSSYAANWSERDELYLACSQDPMQWCINLLQKTCGEKVTSKSIICARSNYKKISKRDLKHNKCMLKVCGMLDGTRNEATNKCYESFNPQCE